MDVLFWGIEMPRIDLFVPFAEKDDAKKLGARWDAAKKVWFIPDGVDPAGFERWLPLKEIRFQRNGEGEWRARIDDLEVGFFPKDGCFIIVWGTERMTPCGYTDGVCPEEKGRDWRNCSLAENCPHEKDYIIEDETTTMVNEGSRQEVEKKIKDMFTNKHDGIAHHQKWPEPAASKFAGAIWVLEG
jgi:hypothetical protein